MKSKILLVLVVLAIGYGIGRWQAPTHPELTVAPSAKTIAPNVQESARPNMVESPKVKKQRTIADVYKPKHKRRLNKEFISKRINRLKQYKPSDFEQNESVIE